MAAGKCQTVGAPTLSVRTMQETACGPQNRRHQNRNA